MNDTSLVSSNEISCCPQVSEEACCDRLRFTYRLENRQHDLPVEIIIIAELERCPGPLSLGDVVYSTTLLPGEKVRLYTSSRNNRFTYDSESEVSYRHERVSEESYYMTSMDRFLSDLTVASSGSGGSRSESEFETEGSMSNWTDAIFGRPDVRASGEYSAESSYDFMRDLSRHAESSHERTVTGTRAAHSVSLGEVQSRTHAEGESESAYEASTRVIENRNRCHAVTYFAYQLMKRQTVRFRIVSVLRRVLDQAGNTTAQTRPLRPTANVAVLPNGILATSQERLDVETMARTSAVFSQANVTGNYGGAGLFTADSARFSATPVLSNVTATGAKPVTPEARAAALEAVDKSLAKAGVIDKVGGEVSRKLRTDLSFERTTCLPTQAIVIKGCLDKCNVCEPSLQKEIEIEIDRKKLENDLLKRQIELLEKSQEYRCCPAGEEEENGDG